MSIADGIIGILKLVGMASGAFIGYKYGDKLQKYCFNQFPVARTYHDKFMSHQLKRSKITDSQFAKGTGMLVGTCIGYPLFVATIPVGICIAIGDYNDVNSKK
jgi:hypothetical protein